MENSQDQLIKNFSDQQKKEFYVDTDVIKLPSEGLLYPNKKDTVVIEYLTAVDENILTSPGLMREGKTFDVLLERKIKDKDINFNDMLMGDVNRILLEIRRTGYGLDYDVKVTCPETGKDFNATVALDKLLDKPLGARPDEKNEFTFVLPMTKKTVKFRLLTYKEEKDIETENVRAVNLGIGGKISQSITKKLIAQIMELDGNRDKSRISQFVDVMPAGDSSKLRKYMIDIEPNVDMRYEFQSPYTGEFFFSSVDTTRLFYPNARV